MQPSKHFCNAPNCPNITANKYCAEHQYLQDEEDRKRAEFLKNRGRKNNYGHKLNSRQRGYTSKWDKYSKWFLSQPQNQLCALRLDDKCARVAQCVDHINPPKDAKDPLFWDRKNHQPACIHCNSVKGHRNMPGKYKLTDGGD